MKHAPILLLGMLLIALLAPLSQFCTLAMTNHDLETASASPWAFGILFSLVLGGIALRLVRKTLHPSRPGLVLLFAMISIAVPVMNLGLVRLLLLNLVVIQEHFVGRGVDTYRRAHEEQRPDWFPAVPDTEGLAYLKAEQIFKLLQDQAQLRARQSAYQRIAITLQTETRRLEHGEEPRAESAQTLRADIARLGTREVERLRPLFAADSPLGPWLGSQGLLELLEQTAERQRAESAAALAQLSAVIERVDERLLYFAPSVRAGLDRGTQRRLKRIEERAGPEAVSALHQAAAALESELLPRLKEELPKLGDRDAAVLREQRRVAYLREFALLTPTELAEVRSDFVFRMRAQERKDLYARAPVGDAPGHDLAALKEGLFRSAPEQAQARENPFPVTLEKVWKGIPWNLWSRPLLHWGALVLVLFLYLMCLAEYLRRKWIERENLAFPLVDVADHLIRHDFRMETAEDLLHPERRRTAFAPAFWVGFAVGALVILIEAVGHFAGQERVVAMDVSANLFSNGPLKELNKVVFVLSPVLLGLFLLVSLEVSFSVWVVYFLFRLVFFAIGQGAQGGIRDPGHVGWASRFFPFEQEQLLGAGLCLGALMLMKAWKAGGGRPLPEADRHRSISPPWMVAGFIGLPVLAYGLVRGLGVTHLGLFLLFGTVFVLLTVASARLRAETGLPLQHVSYDCTRLPLVLGLSRAVGVRSFLNYFSLAFLPLSLLGRLLPQQLENLELARRHRIGGRTMAVAALLAFVTAVGVGLVSLLVMSHWLGGEALGLGAVRQGPTDTQGVLSYPMWVAHFLGEEGLESFTRVHKTRLLFVGIGAAVFGALTFLRGRVLKFPLHPAGYLLLLFSVYHPWLSPWHKGTTTANLEGASWLWGSALVAWIIKSLLVKYGGMNSYRAAKPAFIGLIVGALFTVFAVNVVDLVASLRASRVGHEPTPFEKRLLEAPAYTPKVY